MTSLRNLTTNLLSHITTITSSIRHNTINRDRLSMPNDIQVERTHLLTSHQLRIITIRHYLSTLTSISTKNTIRRLPHIIRHKRVSNNTIRCLHILAPPSTRRSHSQHSSNTLSRHTILFSNTLTMLQRSRIPNLTLKRSLLDTISINDTIKLVSNTRHLQSP